MDKKEKDCGLLIAVLLAGVVFGIVAGAVGLSLLYPAFQSDEWAAWVQAFGSIGAIVAAVIIAKHQSEKSREMLRDRLTQEKMIKKNENDMLIASINKRVLEVIDEARLTCSAILSASGIFMIKDVVTAKEIVIELLVKELNSIDLNEHPATELASDVLKVKIQINRLREAMAPSAGIISINEQVDRFMVRQVEGNLKKLKEFFS